jgi:hypothetical protein
MALEYLKMFVQKIMSSYYILDVLDDLKTLKELDILFCEALFLIEQ